MKTNKKAIAEFFCSTIRYTNLPKARKAASAINILEMS